MSIPNQQDTLHSIGQAMLRSAPAGWRQLDLEVSALADTVETALVVTMGDGSVDRKVRLESGTGRLCGQLRADIYQDGNGTWYNARITVDDQRQVTVEFDYDTPPFGGVIDETDPDSGGDADRALLLEDHRRYPRSAELVPTWHPAHDETSLP